MLFIRNATQRGLTRPSSNQIDNLWTRTHTSIVVKRIVAFGFQPESLSLYLVNIYL